MLLAAPQSRDQVARLNPAKCNQLSNTEILSFIGYCGHVVVAVVDEGNGEGGRRGEGGGEARGQW